MSKFSDWLVRMGLASAKPSVAPSANTSKSTASDLSAPAVRAWVESLEKDAEKVVSLAESVFHSKVAAPMQAKQVVFHRLHKFVEGGVAFTPAQIAAAQYKILIGSASAAQQEYAVPASALTSLAPTAPVTVPFNAIGFAPVPGVTYHVSVVCVLDGISSPVSPTVTFTNSLTPAAVDTVSVS